MKMPNSRAFQNLGFSGCGLRLCGLGPVGGGQPDGLARPQCSLQNEKPYFRGIGSSSGPTNRWNCMILLMLIGFSCFWRFFSDRSDLLFHGTATRPAHREHLIPGHGWRRASAGTVRCVTLAAPQRADFS
jgi:hypothetical protein